MDISRNLKNAISKGKVDFGLEQAIANAKKGKAKLLIVASNCPERKKLATYKKGLVHMYEGDNVTLGTVAGKPFPISVISIIDDGDSNLISMLKKEQQ